MFHVEKNGSRKILICLFFSIFSVLPLGRANGKEASSTKLPEVEKKEESAWQHDSITNTWFKRLVNTLQKNPLTSYGSPLEEPLSGSALLFQGNFTAQKDNQLWILRPSIELSRQHYSLYPLDKTKRQDKINFRFNELYYQKAETTERTWAIGLQSFQWGPGEFLSPSNPIFHFSSEAQDPFYQAHGHNLLRMNYTPDGDHSAVALIELAPNEDKEFIYKTKFVPKGLIKLEYRFTNPANYLGLSIGKEQLGDPFLGEYANISIYEGFSVYFDLKQTRISKRYLPQLDAAQQPQLVLTDYQKSPYLLALWGMRWEGENWDLRWEEIINQLGFTNEEIDNISLSMSPLVNSNAVENQKIFARNGRELLSKGYSYISLRLPHLIPWLDSSLSLRALQTHRDRSRQATVYWEGTAGDHWTFYLISQKSFGAFNSEMVSLYQNKFNFAVKYSW